LKHVFVPGNDPTVSAERRKKEAYRRELDHQMSEITSARPRSVRFSGLIMSPKCFVIIFFLLTRSLYIHCSKPNASQILMVDCFVNKIFTSVYVTGLNIFDVTEKIYFAFMVAILISFLSVDNYTFPTMRMSMMNI